MGSGLAFLHQICAHVEMDQLAVEAPNIREAKGCSFNSRTPVLAGRSGLAASEAALPLTVEFTPLRLVLVLLG